MRHGFKQGIAMIELIFAIVIMGIVLMGAPMLISQATKSSTVTFQQESIAIISAHLNNLTTYAWDENNTNGFAPRSMLNVTSGHPELDQNNTTTKRGSTYALDFPLNRLRSYSDVNVSLALDATSKLGIDGDFTLRDLDDDIDDYLEHNLTLVHDNTDNQANEGEYMDTEITIDTTVTYGDDSASSYTNITGIFAFSQPFGRADIPTLQTTNIKLVTAELTTNEPALQDKRLILRAFMSNIGAATSQDVGGF